MKHLKLIGVNLCKYLLFSFFHPQQLGMLMTIWIGPKIVGCSDKMLRNKIQSVITPLNQVFYSNIRINWNICSLISFSFNNCCLIRRFSLGIYLTGNVIVGNTIAIIAVYIYINWLRFFIIKVRIKILKLTNLMKRNHILSSPAWI